MGIAAAICGRRLKAEASRLGVYVWKDVDCIRAEAPEGFRFEPGLHEMIEVFGSNSVDSDAVKVVTPADARASMLARLERLTGLQVCDCDDCKAAREDE